MNDLSAVSTDAVAMAFASMRQSHLQSEAAMAVARKALDIQAQSAASLIDALPPLPTTLATSGSLGTRLNAWA